MTRSDVFALLEKTIDERNDQRGQGGQAKVAKELGVSDSYLSQIRKNKMEMSPAIHDRIIETYGQETVTCPILGRISRKKCAEQRNRPFAATNPQRIALFRRCPTCGGKP